MAFRSVNMHVEFQLLPNRLDILQTLLVVGSSTADPDLDFVLQEYLCELTESANNTLEGGSNVLKHILVLGGGKEPGGSLR